ncbi:MAG TPA: metal-sensitive transcriptional regulator [Actinomycetota bacterium]|nr:metal-sensitive transcriptional regulator [Actinomycetota bacterium]
MVHGYAADRDEILSRLRKIEGQVRGVQRMVEQGSYCVDVLTQISAVVSGMEKVGVRLLSDHIRGCVRDALASEDQADEKVDELARVVERFVAS